MKYTQRGFVVQGIVALVALVLIASGAYYVSQKKVSAPVGEDVNKTLVPGTKNELKTYTDPKQGYSFQYPAKLSFRTSDGYIVLSHSIPFENRDGGCNMMDGLELSKTLTDFSVVLEVMPGDVKPSYVDGPYSVGQLNGNYAYVGAEGCGQTKYYFPVSGNRTLVVTKNELQVLSPVVSAEVRNQVLAVPGVIPYEEANAILKNILSSLKFTSAVPTLDWKTHTNWAGGYSISYPASYHVAFENDLFNFDENLYEKGYDGGVKIQIQKVSTVTDVTALAKVTFFEKITRGPGGTFSIYNVTGKDGKTNYYKILVWGGENDKENVSKILGSFKFTSLSATNEWKTYTNEKLGFQIKYPSDWEVNLNTENSSVELVNSARKGKPDTDTPREVVSIDTIGTGGKITDCRSTGWTVGSGGIFYKNICVSENLGINMWMSAFDEKGKVVVDSIISTFNFPSSSTTSSEPLPLITSISPTSGALGTRVELSGTGFSGFEGDKYAWIENTKTGIKGIIYNEAGATNNFIPFTLKDKYCTRDNSYSGNPCESYLTITPGEYTIHVYPWGKISNKIKFTVTN